MMKLVICERLVNIVGRTAKQSDLIQEKQRLKILKALRLVNIVGRTAKQSDLIQEKQRLKILKALSVGEISSGRGFNQETTLKHSAATNTTSSGTKCYVDILLGTMPFTSATVKNLHHFRLYMCYAIIGNKVIRLYEYYLAYFDATDISKLEDQLDTYILDIHTDDDLKGLHGLNDLALKLVAKNKHEVYPLVYKLMKLALVLPEATAIVERVFSAMTYIKNHLHNQIGD
ncbi:uncharacterized protein LOC111408501 [Olea europaea var. sylvestris]|uniref:uncharacterized protein LOC111408501 n=1 Tax=Olea europaea var. sylvestris TaxID=158386 RepID=UPI000C1D1EDC|nr:uncharacterized protein LOC111408501 [Olea europaea var. sylvestris]